MCMFSVTPLGLLARLLSPRREIAIPDVADTRIFARLDGAVQGLAYSMRLSTRADIAMILPLPVAHGAGDDALSFVDLSGYPRLFDDLGALFPRLEVGAAKSRGLFSFGARQAPLKVHEVGAFDASFVPSLAAFDRLDPRFRLPSRIWDALPRYRDFGFAVFKLRRGSRRRIHPMAFRFPTRDPSSIFFPTVHVHDGEVHPRASFDHYLYYQLERDAAAPTPSVQYHWRSGATLTSEQPAEASVDIQGAKGLVRAGARVMRRGLWGEQPNEDVWIPADGSSLPKA